MGSGAGPDSRSSVDEGPSSEASPVEPSEPFTSSSPPSNTGRHPRFLSHWPSQIFGSQTVIPLPSHDNVMKTLAVPASSGPHEVRTNFPSRSSAQLPAPSQ